MNYGEGRCPLHNNKDAFNWLMGSSRQLTNGFSYDILKYMKELTYGGSYYEEKLVIRTDDLGYTRVHDMGAFETYINGYSAHAEVILDSPGTVDAQKKLKELP
jgi:hypothetical protein